MGWDVYAIADLGGPRKIAVGKSFNYTYNTRPMLYEVGIDWHILIGHKISYVIEILETGINELKSRPEHFKKMNPENGWGDYDSLLWTLHNMIEEFKNFPDAELGAWL